MVIPAAGYRLPVSLGCQKRRSGNQCTKKRRQYKDIICAFDIETTRIPEIEQSVMYIWQMQVGLTETVIGRTWEEFLQILRQAADQMPDGEYFVFYVHNLSYEFQFFRGIYDFSPEEVFAVDRRKVLKCEMFKHFEFRCSYLHSNMSLGLYTSKMGAKHTKLSGDDFDYSARRWSYSELTAEQLEYCYNDVRGLVEALSIEMFHDKDNLYTIPMTSTGYVRRDAKKAMREAPFGLVSKCVPDMEVYTMLREAFRGGNTHANRYFAGDILTSVSSYDRSSSYPDVLCNCQYPVSAFERDDPSVDRMQDLIYIRGRAVLARIAFRGVRLQNKYWGCPYLTADKSRHMVDEERDNGRILSAAYLETTVTDVDLEIILGEYTFDELVVIDLFSARYGGLPRPLIELNIDYYERKTELKGVAGSEILYMKSKNKLNSIYGMMAQNPVKQDIIFQGGEWLEADEDLGQLLAESNRKAFLSYAWGCWCTAWARYRLEDGIRIAGDNFVYCDTDSVKFIGSADFSDYNEERVLDSLTSGAYARDPAGVDHYMGVYESEGVYDRFVTLGAKKYAYEQDGKLSVTVAGVNKKYGAAELSDRGGIDAFRPGLVFERAGGTESVYNDAPYLREFVTEHGIRIPITANVVIKPSLYTLGITGEYAEIINHYHRYRAMIEESMRVGDLH